MAVTAKGTPYVESSDNVADYPGVSLALANHIDDTAGKVLQVVSVTKTDTFTTTSSSYADITGLTATITPSSVNSKIYISSVINGHAMSTTQGYFQLVRGSTAIAVGDAAGARIQASTQMRNISGNNGQQSVGILFLDAPASISALTYKIQTRNQGDGTIFVNRSQSDVNSGDSSRTVSTITLMEISA